MTKLLIADKRTAKGVLLFKAARNTFLDSTRVFLVSDAGVVSEANVSLKNKKTIVSVPATSAAEFACVTSARQTDCFDLR